MTLRIILTAAVLWGSFAGAQAAPSAVTSPHLQLRDDGSLRATLVSSGGSTASIRTATLRQSGTWFTSVHPQTSLTEVADYYRDAFTRLGFKRTSESATEKVVIWTLQKGGRQVSVVFNQQGAGVVANIAWL